MKWTWLLTKKGRIKGDLVLRLGTRRMAIQLTQNCLLEFSGNEAIP